MSLWFVLVETRIWGGEGWLYLVDEVVFPYAWGADEEDVKILVCSWCCWHLSSVIIAGVLRSFYFLEGGGAGF
jgi:hypothetical protein